MKLFIVSVLTYALVAQASVLPLIPHVGKLGHTVAAGVANSVGITATAGVHAAVHGAEQVGAAVVGTGLEALESGSGVVSGIKDGITNGIHGLGLGSDKHLGRPGIFDRPESQWKEGAIDVLKEHGGDIGEKLHKRFDFYKHDELDGGFDYASHDHKEHDSHEHKEHDSHEHKEHDSHEHKEHKSHEHGKHHGCHKRDKRESHKHRKET